MGATVIGLDCGLAAFGVAVVELGDVDGSPGRMNGPGDVVRHVEVLRTEVEAARSKGEDDLRRLRWLLHGLDRVIDRWRPVAACAEIPMSAKGSRAAQSFGMGKTLIAAVGHYRHLPLETCSPIGLKKAVCGSKKASKEQIAAALSRDVRGARDLLESLSKGDLEHGADAVGSFIACRDRDVIRMARQMREPTLGPRVMADGSEPVFLNPADPRQMTLPGLARANGGA